VITTPTTIVDIIGGGEESPWGDQVEGTDVRVAGLPAAIHEGAVSIQTESDPQARAVRYYVMRLPGGGDVPTKGERVRDTLADVIYVVDAVTFPTNPALPQDVRVDLRRVT
jgi:hypothetical protein